MKQLTILSLLTITCILFTACKKYPEGGTEKDGPNNIIYHWTLSLYEVDGIDSTDLINYSGTQNYKQIYFSALNNVKNSKQINAHPAYASLCIMEFSSNNETLTGTVNPYYGAKFCNPICGKEIFTPETSTSTWKILKLTKNELHLQSQQIHLYNLKFNR